MNQDWTGTCEPSVSIDFDYILYPGYRCRGDEVFGVWRFGSKICNNDDRWEGYPVYSKCRRSSDCNFGHYCNEDGICLKLINNGEACTTHDSCEKNSFWYYYNPEQSFGICAEVASLDERELAQPEYKDNPVAQADMEKMCRSGMVNRTTGRWATKLKSTNKGKEWTTDNDWETTDDNVKAAWKWGYNADGKKYWDIEAGDDEWVDATSKFQEFYLLNLDWHSGEGFGQWGNTNSKYKEYKWAEFKAKNYVELLNHPDWLKATYKNNPVFWEYHLYWHAWNFQSFLYLFSIVVLFQTIWELF